MRVGDHGRVLALTCSSTVALVVLFITVPSHIVAAPADDVSRVSALAAAGSACTADAVSHLRPVTGREAELIALGCAASPTFREVVKRLRGTDVIVLVQLRWFSPEGIEGQLDFTGDAHGVRYVRAWLDGIPEKDAQIVTLAHELEHAGEVARNRAVRTGDAFRRFYTECGIRGERDTRDTEAARRTGERVRLELRDWKLRDIARLTPRR